MSFGTKGCMYCEGECNKECLPKQDFSKEWNETSEEAASKLFGSLETGIGAERRTIWMNGAKWQAERMYSEEEVDLFIYKLIGKFTDWSGSYVYKDKLIEIYEQLKKK